MMSGESSRALGSSGATQRVPLGGPFDDVAVPRGTNLLVSGPPMSGKRTLLFDALADRGPADPVVVVSTDDGPERVFRALDCDPVNAAEERAAVVDCVSSERGDAPSGAPTVVSVASPDDLTGIGIGSSTFLSRFDAGEGDVHRVAIDSLSTILHYADPRAAFRFLHVFTNRVRSVDGVGFYVVNPDAHDDRELARVSDLFDGALRVETTDEGPRCRLHGVGGDAEGEWRDL
ncbi:RAD55 family ATPase [Halarchaeum sp. P4]|uniref:RAD55 family ATPase n=1 Tax=Halarchaeum sp. P4 TaxID=3421639 RepID=UPI003EBE035E